MIPQAIAISTAPGELLAGQAWDVGPAWIVLVHPLGADLDAWGDVPRALARAGISVLALDLRGHGGSSGRPDPAAVGDDIAAACDWLGAAGAVCTGVAGAGDTGPDALAADAASFAVAIAPAGACAAPARHDRLRRQLLIADTTSYPTAARIRDVGRGSAVVVRLPVAAPGLELLEGTWRTNVLGYLRTFARDALRATATEARAAASRRMLADHGGRRV